MIQKRQGILYPNRLPEFHRVPPVPELAHAVRWFWIAKWDLPSNGESRQELLPFPACNVVVEPSGVSAIGPPTHISERILRGSGWVVGALLLPAAVPSLVSEPAALRDSSRSLDLPELHAEVSRFMSTSELSPSATRARSVEAISVWIAERVPPLTPGSEQALANELALILSDPDVTRADQIPERLPMSARSLHRLATRFFGLSLHSMIRRRRLQEAAERLRVDPTCSIAELASELGYSDHSHFSTDFKAVLGMTPRRYRESLSN